MTSIKQLRRLRATREQVLIFRPRIMTKDKEGVPVESFGDAVRLRGEVWPATSRAQVEQYGDRVTGIQNARLSGSYEVTRDGGGLAVTFQTGTIRLGDGLYLYADPETDTPDYSIISITASDPIRLEVEAR